MLQLYGLSQENSKADGLVKKQREALAKVSGRRRCTWLTVWLFLRRGSAAALLLGVARLQYGLRPAWLHQGIYRSLFPIPPRLQIQRGQPSGSAAAAEAAAEENAAPDAPQPSAAAALLSPEPMCASGCCCWEE